MRTRELLAYDTRVLASKVRGLKPKELRRHIDRISADLGATDTDALLARILEAVLALQKPSETESEEETRNETATIVRALAGHIEVTEQNLDLVLRLTLISATYLRHLLQQRVREMRRAERADHQHANHHHGGHQCGDPQCQEHGDDPRARAQPEPSPLAPTALGTPD
jgi:hypothetical protein